MPLFLLNNAELDIFERYFLNLNYTKRENTTVLWPSGSGSVGSLHTFKFAGSNPSSLLKDISTIYLAKIRKQGSNLKTSLRSLFNHSFNLDECGVLLLPRNIETEVSRSIHIDLDERWVINYTHDLLMEIRN